MVHNDYETGIVLTEEQNAAAAPGHRSVRVVVQYVRTELALATTRRPARFRWEATFWGSAQEW